MARPMTTAATSFCPRSVVRNASHSATVDAPIAMTRESATKQQVVVEFGVPPHCRHAGVVHGGNAKSHEDAAENEAKRRSALATNDVKAAAGYDHRHHERKGGQSDVVGHRYRHDEGEHGDEVHRPYSASHCDRGSHQPHATRKSPGGSHMPTEIEGGVDAKEATRMDRATRYGSCVPV